ncbi:MAG: hypothetical protein R3B09_00010 [Nannocystaceae bacterium]
MHDDDSLDHYARWRVPLASPALELDLADAGLDRGDPSLLARLDRAIAAMADLEAGAIANPDEGRQVGHYWLRAPNLSPETGISEAIQASWAQIDALSADVASGAVAPPGGGRYRDLLLIGIGGSALGPQLLADALARPGAGLRLHVLDNIDPDGIDRVLAAIDLAHALVLVISKSGSTVETQGGMLAAEAAFARAGRSMAPQTIAITCAGSRLDQRAAAEGWLATVPMWEWVGGRTSVTATVGLLPAALLGIDWRGLLAGAAAMDAATRAPARENPAALLAWLWYEAGAGHGRRDMVVLPYRDALCLLSRYLQQLVMESLGKRLDRQGAEVWQGLSVFGNKGSTDQHAYVQQLRDGLDNFFALFVRVLADAGGPRVEVSPGASAGECLDGFYLGTRAALRERGRRSGTIVLQRLDAESLGAIIALFERAVGLYAELLDVNAYHQPGVEAGKLAARGVLDLQRKLLAILEEGHGPMTARALASAVDADPLDAWHTLRRLAADPTRGVRQRGDEPRGATFEIE